MALKGRSGYRQNLNVMLRHVAITSTIFTYRAHDMGGNNFIQRPDHTTVAPPLKISHKNKKLVKRGTLFGSNHER